MFQLHIVCKDSKVIRYLFYCSVVDATAGQIPLSTLLSPSAAAGIELFRAKVAKAWYLVHVPS